jgi:hypothetical protein
MTALSRRWHRFDVEYQLPVDLPTSFKSSDGKLVYFATASVTVVHLTSSSLGGSGSLNSTTTIECRARDIRFRVEGNPSIILFIRSIDHLE